MISARSVQNRKFKIHLNGLKLIINEKKNVLRITVRFEVD